MNTKNFTCESILATAIGSDLEAPQKGSLLNSGSLEPSASKALPVREDPAAPPVEPADLPISYAIKPGALQGMVIPPDFDTLYQQEIEDIFYGPKIKKNGFDVPLFRH